MAFADDLRKTQPPKKPKAVDDYDKKCKDIYSSVLSRFKGECQAAAQKGKRSIVCIPSSQGYGGLYACGIPIGKLWEVDKRAEGKRMANEIKEMLDKAISEMNFTRYKIRIENKTVYAAYGANIYYYHFIIEAKW